MARIRTIFGYVTRPYGESSGDQYPPLSGSPPNMGDAAKKIERKLGEYKQKLMREALAEQHKEVEKKRLEEVKKKRLEDEKRERKEKGKEDEHLRLLEEERARHKDDFDRQMLQ